MGKISKTFALFLTLIVVMSCLILTVKPANAQTITKPPVPEFTVKYIDNLQYVPPTSTTDPYTGQTQNKDGYYSRSEPKIEVRIKNIANNTRIFYSVRFKGHFSEDWSVIAYWDAKAGTSYNSPNPYPEQDYSSQYTVLYYSQNIPSQGQMDFQVKALIGNITVSGGDSDSLIYNMLYPTYTFTGESSDWSNTQTISIGQSGFLSSNIIVLALISVIIILFLVITSILLFRRHRKTVYLKQ